MIKLTTKDLNTIIERMHKITSLLHTGTYEYQSLVGTFTMIENYARESKEALMESAGAKDIFNTD